MSNQDMSAHPRVNQWSNGAEPTAELNRMMEVRRAALNNFGERNIRLGAPMATMEEVLVPLYMHHRYQVSLRPPLRWVASTTSTRCAVTAARRSIRSRAPTRWRRSMRCWRRSRRANWPFRSRSSIRCRRVRPATDAAASSFRATRVRASTSSRPAVVAADHTVSEILNAQRAARLVQQHALDESLPGLGEVIDRLGDATFGATPANSYEAEINRAVEGVVVDRSDAPRLQRRRCRRCVPKPPRRWCSSMPRCRGNQGRRTPTRRTTGC